MCCDLHITALSSGLIILGVCEALHFRTFTKGNARPFGVKLLNRQSLICFQIYKITNTDYNDDHYYNDDEDDRYILLTKLKKIITMICD